MLSKLSLILEEIKWSSHLSLRSVPILIKFHTVDLTQVYRFSIEGIYVALRKLIVLIGPECLRCYPRDGRPRLRDAEDDLSVARDYGSPRTDSDVTTPPRRLTLIPSSRRDGLP